MGHEICAITAWFKTNSVVLRHCQILKFYTNDGLDNIPKERWF